MGDDQHLRYGSQDEMRAGLKNDSGRVITSKGVKPVAPAKWGRDNFWLYGVVEPLAGWHFCREYPHLNGEHFQSFLNDLSAALGEDVMLLQMDQAGAHQAKALDWPDNIIPVFQPSHSPELNPIERFWQHVRAQLKGAIFENLDQLRQRLKELLNTLTTEEVASLTSYDFILEALFCAAL
ncbi:MAG: IS630 family transposase [Cyanothece sp. SIO1E1]|nr:IS630 family transposase [Cyanothece sp. SIO1E1]